MSLRRKIIIEARGFSEKTKKAGGLWGLRKLIIEARGFNLNPVGLKFLPGCFEKKPSGDLKKPKVFFNPRWFLFRNIVFPTRKNDLLEPGLFVLRKSMNLHED